MPKKIKHICTVCGASHAKWQGQCEGCGAWNTLIEEQPDGVGNKKIQSGSTLKVTDLQTYEEPLPRWETGIGELDRVCGGGLTPGAAVLIGGDPGIGKSTLLLQLSAAMAERQTALYITGEESTQQIRHRAVRLGVEHTPVKLASASNLSDIVATIKQQMAKQTGMVVIDSIQTLYADVLDSAPGTVSQVRYCAQVLVKLAKEHGFCLWLVGHVTKEGALAGPRVLEHLVDTVLYFEGDRGQQCRILRTVKNRFGATDEIGVFMMEEKGLQGVENPSALFLSQREHPVSGAAVLAGMEGTRPVLVEIEALAAPSPLGTPRRTTVGYDNSRLAMILAVLETRCGVSFAGRDVYLNVAGGLKITEPAADLVVAAALISSLKDVPLPDHTILFGEIGLTGEVRTVSQAGLRLKESTRLGYRQALIPQIPKAGSQDIKVTSLSSVMELVAVLG